MASSKDWSSDLPGIDGDRPSADPKVLARRGLPMLLGVLVMIGILALLVWFAAMFYGAFGAAS